MDTGFDVRFYLRSVYRCELDLVVISMDCPETDQMA